MNKALDRLKIESDKPGFRSIEIFYRNGAFHLRSRKTWDWEEDR